jgi:hypothetical protein
MAVRLLGSTITWLLSPSPVLLLFLVSCLMVAMDVGVLSALLLEPAGDAAGARMVVGASRSMGRMLEEPSSPLQEQEDDSIDLQACQCDSETLQCFSDIENKNTAPLLQEGDLLMVCLAFPQGIELTFVSSLTLAQASAYSSKIMMTVDAIVDGRPANNLTTVTTRQPVLPNNGTSSSTSLTMISPSLLARQKDVIVALETPVWGGFFLAPRPAENPPTLIVTGEVVHKLVTVDGDDFEKPVGVVQLTRGHAARDDGPARHREREHISDSERQLYSSPVTARSTFELQVKVAPVITQNSSISALFSQYATPTVASSSLASFRTCLLGRCWLSSSLVAIVVAVLSASTI